MLLHIALDDDLVAGLDHRAGPRQRSAFIAELIRRGLENERRWDDIAAAAVGIGASLATANISDFPMKELSVDIWPTE
jgi:metal-responsive CopG/Arc/MetJ family transcriptional regulator